MTELACVEETGTALERALAILVVDDDRGFRGALSRLLTLDGHTVCAVANGREALDALQNRGWDVICIDLQLPDVHGVRLARYARERFPSSYIALVTGYAAAMDDAALRTPWVDVVLPKPWKAAELETVLAGARARQQARVAA